MTQEERPTALVFGVTLDDVGVLEDDEFDAVWAALGKIVRARSRPAEANQQREAEK
ncbi:MAG: hypothetical protein M3P96_06355 [Actinomycetota bacterium]|nr:hypothetical protein [Actinomycetota bacterium]